MKTNLNLIILFLFINFGVKSQPQAQQFNYSANDQTFTVPCGVTSITINAVGAPGGGGYFSTTGQVAGGLPTRMIGTFAVTPGDVLNIRVARKGGDFILGGGSGAGGGGGGASWVYNTTSSTIMIVAGGGGGGPTAGNATITNTGTAGGTSPNGGGGGGGYLGNGAGSVSQGIGGQSYINGGAIVAGSTCTSPCSTGGSGGRGGGGGGGSEGGGGGGYSGGKAGFGGGSYNGGTSQTNTTGDTYFYNGGGQVIISYTLPSNTPTITTNLTTICSGQIATLSVTNPCSNCTFNWSNGMTGQSVSINSTGVYTATATGSCGTSPVSNSINITVNQLPTVTANASNPIVCSASPTTLSGSGASSYTWSNGVTNNIAFNPTITNTYTVTGTDANGCSNTTTATVTVNQLPIVTANATASSFCIGGSTTLTGGGAFTYSWSNGVTDGVAINPTITNTYTVTGTDGNSCVNTATKLITVNPLPAVTANATVTNVCIGNTITLTGGGATSYTWSDGVTNGAVFSPSTSHTYTVTGTDANGCVNTATKTITINPLPTVTANATSTLICSGAAVTLTGSGASSYVWSNGVTNGLVFHPTTTNSYTVTGTDANGCINTNTKLITVNPLPNVIANATVLTFCLGGSTILTGGGASSYTWTGGITDGVSFNPSSTTTYTVTGTDGNGCSSSATKLITVNPLPIVTANATSTSVCNGNTTTLTGGGASTYVWSNGVVNSVAFVPTATNTYTVTGTDANGCVNTTTKLITLNPLPTVIANATLTTVCSGSAVTLTGSGAFSYVWSNGVTNGIVFHPTSSNTYTVTGTDANGCVNTATQLITVNPLPTVTANATVSSLCIGASVTLSGGGASSYVWSGGVTDGSSFNPVITNTYTVTGTNANGCINTSTKTITVNPLPTVTANATVSSLCIGGSVTLTGGGATSYTWSDGETNGVIFSPASTHTYTVTGTNANGCVNTATKLITVNQLPTVTANATATSFCVGGSTILTGGGATSYGWSGGVSDGVSFNPIGTTTYTVTGTDGNSCTNTATKLITVNPLPTVTANATATAVCIGSSVTLSGGGATSYVWTNSVINGISFNPTNTTTYIVTGTDGNGCVNSATKLITVNPLPSINVTSGATVFCTNSANTALVGLPAGGTWAGAGVIGNLFKPFVSGAGNFSVIYSYTNTNGCRNSDSIQMTVNAAPSLSVAAADTLFCVNHASESLIALPSGGSWSGTGISGNAFVPSVAGTGVHTITYSYTDGNGCSNTATLNMTVDLCTGINSIEYNEDIIIYPNPFTEQTTISFSAEQKSTTIKIMDVTGREIKNLELIIKNEKSTTLDMSGFAKGIYFVQIMDDNKNVVNRKILVE